MVLLRYSLQFFLMKSLLMISLAVSLEEGSKTRQLSTIWTNSFGQLSGRFLSQPFRILILSQAMSLPEKGCQKVIIQQSRQPRDHISVAVEQGRYIQISGLVQKGVPILVLAIPFLLIELTFISPSFMQLSSPMKKLSALTSLWIMFILCRAASPLAISLTKTLISQGQKGRFYFLLRIISCKKSPPSAHYITRQSCFSSRKASLYYMMLGWHILESILISFMQLFLSARVIQAIFIFFRAYTWWSRWRLTLNTLEKEPEPIWFNIQNAFITEKYIKNKNLIISQPEACAPEFLPYSPLWPLLPNLEAQ